MGQKWEAGQKWDKWDKLFFGPNGHFYTQKKRKKKELKSKFL